MAITSSLYALAFLLCSTLNEAVGAAYHIATTSTDPGCRSPCLTLSQFQSNMGSYLSMNTELIFLAGTHQLTSSLTITNVRNFSMIRSGSSSSSATVRIICLNYNSVNFRNSENIYIVGMEFIGCGRTSNEIENVGNFVLRDSKFQGQESSGTALELTGTTAQIFNCRFMSNSQGKYIQFWEIIQVYGTVGGAILASNSSVNISQSHFEGNMARYGGAMYVERGSVVHITDSSFSHNNATRNGGGVLFSYISSIMIEASTFRYNSGPSGGVFDPWYCNITIINSSFDNSTSGSAGGVAYVHFSNMTIKSSNFTNTYAGFSGGVIYTGSSNITIESSNFENNTGWAGGALISFQRSMITIKYSRFYRNTAPSSSGGAMDNHESKVIIIESEFVNNYTPQGGGALYSRGGTNLTVEGCRFTSNAATSGGAMYSISSNIIIIACTFADNMATGYGTGLYSSGSTVTIRETCAFVATSPNYMAGILFSSGGTIMIEDPSTIMCTTEQEPLTTSTKRMVEEPTTAVMMTVTDETTAAVTLVATSSETVTSNISVTVETNNAIVLATTTSIEDNATISTSREAGGIDGSSILTSMGFMIGVIGALAGLVIILSLALVVVILCRCGKNHQKEKGGKSGKSVVNEGVLSTKMCHANLDTDAAMTSNASYDCASAEKGTIEGLYESLFDDKSQYVIYDNYI